MADINHVAMLTRWADASGDISRAFDRWSIADTPPDDVDCPDALSGNQRRLIAQISGELHNASAKLYALAISFQDPPQ